ncbi:VanZ family protein [Paludisphaera sp.]|uniref:VanZ family protein n=1 Tax=Paludisphaera sp. TaxID=2017432 RepID=UPI00301C1C3E
MPRRIVVALLSAHVLVFLALTLAYSNPATPGRIPLGRRVNPWPFASIRRDLAAGGEGLLVNLVGNVVVMLPLGAAAAVLGGQGARAWHAALAGLVLSATVETLQMGTGRRVADVDDVILNTLGAALGFMTAAAVRRAWRRGGRGASGQS